MGKKSREKWIKRAEVYEGITLKGNEAASQAFLSTIKEKKLGKLIKGAQELESERDEEAQEAPRESED